MITWAAPQKWLLNHGKEEGYNPAQARPARSRLRALSNLPVPHDTVEAGDFESDCFCPPPRRAGDLRAGGARPPWGMLGVGFGSRGAWSPGRCGLAAAASGRLPWKLILASGRSPSGACSPAFRVSRGPRGVFSSAV